MLERLLMAGEGGQGIVLIGKLLATAALRTVPHITFFPAYGAEVRGGTSNCSVVLSSEEIDSPVPEVFDSMLIMNQASLDRFRDQRAAEGLLFINRSLCAAPASLGAIAVPATATAAKLGDARAANFVMLGAYLAARPLVPIADVEEAVRDAFARKDGRLTELNIAALAAGMRGFAGQAAAGAAG